MTAAGPEGIELDRTLFYASSGGQPGDTGRLVLADGREIAITGTVHPDGDRGAGAAPHRRRGARCRGPATRSASRLDWDRRYRLMRMHSALHLLSVVLPYGVTGGSIGEDKGRLDFDMPEPPEDVAALEARLNDYVAAGLPVAAEWITEDELAARPEMVKTMKVKPPVGPGPGAAGPDRRRARRPSTCSPAAAPTCARRPRSGRLRIGKIEKKGRENRRVNLHFAD